MHETTKRSLYGWQFVLVRRDGSKERFTLERLDRKFDLGIRGSAHETGALALRVAEISDSHVEVTFNGAKIASAAPSHW